MGPAYNELGYNEHGALWANFFLRKEHFWLTSMFKKFGYNECHFNEHIFMNQISRCKRDLVYFAPLF